MPDFCYAFGRIGHTHKECEDDTADKVTLEFGSWMKATSFPQSGRFSASGINQNSDSYGEVGL